MHFSTGKCRLTESIVSLRKDQHRQAAEVLARAFFEDPLMRYYLPDRTARNRALAPIMLASLRYCFFYGSVDTTPGLDGLACWLSPGQTDVKTWGWIRSGFGVVPLSIGLRAFYKIQAIESMVDRIHHQCVPDPHWYLMVLGVSPDQQGKGIGGALIENRLSLTASSGYPCYLETMSEQNVAFYRGHGFKVVHEIELFSGILKIWSMLRESASLPNGGSQAGLPGAQSYPPD